MFPASKYFPDDSAIDDPLEDLISEFPELASDELEARSEALSDLFDGLGDSNTSIPETIEAMKQQMQLLNEVSKRIKFYLDEIEIFAPYRNR
jgi:hypothetical protein